MSLKMEDDNNAKERCARFFDIVDKLAGLEGDINKN